MDPKPDFDLVSRFQDGDVAAFKEIYERHNQRLFSIAFRILRSFRDAEDALQNCFIRLHKSINNFRFEAPFSSYLVRIMINCCYDILQKRPDFDTVGEENPDLFQQSDSQHWQLEQAIEKLPLKMRECFILFAVEGFSQQEIAAMLDLSVGTIKAHIFQARAKLRDILT